MNKNVGKTDSLLRIVLGMAALAVSIISFLSIINLGTVPSAVLAAVGIVMLVTAKTRSCVLYRPFGVDTTGKD